MLTGVFLDGRTQVHKFAKVARISSFHADAGIQVVMRGNKDARKCKRIHCLSTFVLMLARQLSHIQRIYFVSAEWAPSLMHADVCLHLSAFSSVTNVMLRDVTFPSLQTLGRLVCSLPNLQHLYCRHLSSIMPTFDAVFFQNRPFVSMTSHLYADGASTGQAIEFFVSAKIAAGLKEVNLGYREPIHMGDVQTFGILRLKVLDITLVGTRYRATLAQGYVMLEQQSFAHALSQLLPKNMPKRNAKDSSGRLRLLAEYVRHADVISMSAAFFVLSEVGVRF